MRSVEGKTLCLYGMRNYPRNPNKNVYFKSVTGETKQSRNTHLLNFLKSLQSGFKRWGIDKL